LKPPKGIDTFQGMSEKWLGWSIDLTGAYRRQILKALPRTLIFDDLERANLNANQLLGYINKFVEHEQKNVILIAHEDKLRCKKKVKRNEYESIKEKVIGRTVSIVAETEIALDSFLKDMPNSLGMNWLKTSALLGNSEAQNMLATQSFLEREKSLILDIFDRSESYNLRLLRQSLLDFSRFYSKIPEYIRAYQHGMRSLLATFLALTIAYNRGNGFTENDLRQHDDWSRAIWNVNGSQGKEPDAKGIDLLRRQYSEAPEVQLYSKVLSGDLAKALIANGYAERDFIRYELESTEFFKIRESEAWQVLWWWVTRSDEEVLAALKQVKEQLEKLQLRSPEVILQLSGILLDLADNGIGWDTRSDARNEMLSYIQKLESGDLLSIERPKESSSEGNLNESSFGLEIKQQNTDEYQEIFSALTEALDRAFWGANEERARKLIVLAGEDVGSFVAVISNNGRPADLPNYSQLPVLAGVNPAEAAQAIFALPYDKARIALSPFKERIHRLEGLARSPNRVGWPSERSWLIEFRDESEKLAAAESVPLRSSKIRKILEWQLAFLRDP
tara:strand:+ start:18206 stop:19888 length:1683 start_codon:yes stop_codon:yes gene_type:complete